MSSLKRVSIVMVLAARVLLFTAVLINGPVSARAQAAETAATSQKTFHARGVVRELKPDGTTVVIQHEEVTNYMPAMTMPFDVKDTGELKGLQPGDGVTFQIIVTDRDAWIDHITKLNATQPAQPAAHPNWRVVRDVEPLKVGDALPEYHFTNEFGRAVSTRQFKGQALVFTFFFTRCPYPTFCPFLSHSFEDTQTKLKTMAGGPANWHLLSISFDTETDSPAALKAYAGAYHYNPEHWSFVTGDLTEISAIADQVGAYFGHDESGGITHNLRTVVVDAQGRVQRVFTDNRWTSDELVAEIVKAAQAKP
jgi:protein SCO1/2